MEEVKDLNPKRIECLGRQLAVDAAVRDLKIKIVRGHTEIQVHHFDLRLAAFYPSTYIGGDVGTHESRRDIARNRGLGAKLQSDLGRDISLYICAYTYGAIEQLELDFAACLEGSVVHREPRGAFLPQGALTHALCDRWEVHRNGIVW